ncbi:MAG TPA: ABC transporter permease [Bryobacteraceae bacterium]|nr:ABC transporter permease [Bryobacteraceae bacterium]
MRVLKKIRLRFRSLFRRGTVESEMQAELVFHLDQQIEENLASGMPPGEAREAALRTIGTVSQFHEECRDMRRVNFIENLWQDLRFGIRLLRQSPTFTVVAVLTVALGIGANTAIFSVVYAALLRPLPYAEPDRLITLGEVRRQEDSSGQLTSASWVASYPDFRDWRQQSKAFASLAGFDPDGFTLRGAGEPESVPAVEVTPNFFHTLGVQPFLGRDFAPGEDQPSGPHVAILTYGFWKSRFGGDPHVIGRSIQLDSNSVTIAGILPPDFEFAPRGNGQIWVPLHISNGLASRRNLRWMRVIGRLAPGSTPAQAAKEMELIGSHLAAEYPQENGSLRLVIAPLRDRIVGMLQPLLLVLFGAVGFVLLIACANVANLLMARATRRRREFAVRTALGAGRRRLISQLLSESVILAACGAALGLLLARSGTVLLIAAIPEAMLNTMPFLRDAGVNPMVLAFLLCATIITAVAFGITPAFEASTRDAAGALKDEARSSAGRTSTRLRHALVITEIAFSLVLLVGAGLMVKSLTALLNRNPGFDTRRLLTFSVFLPDASYPKDPDAIRFNREFSDRVRVLPGVAGIATISIIPLTGGGNTIRFVNEGRPVPTGQESESSIRNISAGYFSLMGIPLVQGRFFNDSADAATAPQHIIVNQAWAKRYLPGEDPIGKRIRFTFSPKQTFREIVGVVGNIADAGLDSPEEPILFVPYLQGPDSFITYVVRTLGDPANSIGALRSTLRSTDPQLIMIQPTAMEQIISQSQSVFLRRYPSVLIGSFAVLALILAAVGLYGLISYSVSQHMRELGIRIALGAQPSDVIRLVLGEGARLALIGLGAGILAALGLTQLMRSLLYGVSPLDPLTFATVAGLLLLVAFVACYIPARRAIRTDPIAALRCQ